LLSMTYGIYLEVTGFAGEKPTKISRLRPSLLYR